MKVLSAIIFIAICIAAVNADCYLHNPRGSVNRLNEQSATTNNQARLCDTQNNNNGGYCWGPSMHYYEGSQLTIEWTNQHSCGQQKNDCDIILQYMCGDNVRDGTTTNTIPDTVAGSENPQFGMHENYQYYQSCKERERNKGLFTADRNLNNNQGARATRQNNNGNRRGYECPEERDYYPYWHPTPWKDIAVLTTREDKCEWYIQESQNVKEKGYCTDPQHNNPTSCGAGNWENAQPWNKINPEIPAPVCQKAAWSRDNHLGNGMNGYANTYNWTIPKDYGENCVFRIRYNISTHRTPWNTDSSKNGANSPVKQDPYMYFHPNMDQTETHFRLAIDTSQFGRTFQDRSHVFAIKQRPDDIDANRRIFNLNVRGKRGNIVQAYPAVEYDFVPNILHVKSLDYVHFQWTGCDTNPQNFAGEGRQGTDRSNLVILEDIASNYYGNMTKDPQVGGKGVADTAPGESNGYFFKYEVGQTLAWINQAGCTPYNDLNNNADQDPKNCAKLNAATTPYFNGGVVRIEKTGTVNYMSARNNNFSNRGQKGVMISTELVATFGIVLLAVSSVVFAAGVVVAILVKVSASVATSVVG